MNYGCDENAGVNWDCGEGNEVKWDSREGSVVESLRNGGSAVIFVHVGVVEVEASSSIWGGGSRLEVTFQLLALSASGVLNVVDSSKSNSQRSVIWRF